MSNKRIRKKHYWLGSKRAGTNHCRCVIGNGIRWRYEDATGVESKRRNIMRYLRWFYIHSSQNEWDDSVEKYRVNTQCILSAKHLLSQPSPSSLQSIERRYGGDRCVLKGIEHMLEGDNDGNNKMNYIYRSAWIRTLIRANGLPLHNDIIFFRPQRGSLEESMKELEIFTSVDEMFDFIVEHQPFDDVFDKSDLSIGEDIGPDGRIGWSETRYILTKRCCGKVYDTPQCIGMCSFEKIKEEN